MRTVPVFMYHHVNRHSGDLVTLSPEDFENHLRILQEKKIRSLFLGELISILRKDEPLAPPAVVLTFDDGHLDNWVYAFPLLQKYRVKATIFVITSWMTTGEVRRQWNPEGGGETGFPRIPRHKEVKKRVAEGDFSVGLRWEEARIMEQSGLVDIQSHSHGHDNFFVREGDLCRLDPQRKEFLQEDLALSKKLIEENLSKNCRFLAWPWGMYDLEATDIASSMGFEGMVTTEKGVNFPGSDERTIKRVVAKSGDPSWFAQRYYIYSHRTLGRIYSRITGTV